LMEGFDLISFFGPIHTNALLTFYQSYLLVENRIFILDHIINTLLSKKIPVFFNKICKIINPDVPSFSAFENTIPLRGPRKFKLCVCEFCCDYVNSRPDFRSDYPNFKPRYNPFITKKILRFPSPSDIPDSSTCAELMLNKDPIKLPFDYFDKMLKGGINRQFLPTLWPSGHSTLSSYFFSLSKLDAVTFTSPIKRRSTENVYPTSSYIPFSFRNPLHTYYSNYYHIYSNYKQQNYAHYESVCRGYYGQDYNQHSDYFQF